MFAVEMRLPGLPYILVFTQLHTISCNGGKDVIIMHSLVKINAYTKPLELAFTALSSREMPTSFAN